MRLARPYGLSLLLTSSQEAEREVNALFCWLSALSRQLGWDPRLWNVTTYTQGKMNSGYTFVDTGVCLPG